MKTLVLGLGNELLSDDAVGILAARALKPRLDGRADVVESALSGLALLDLFIGYDRAIIIDAIQTGKSSPGTVLEISPADLDAVRAPSAHYCGLPELLAIARELALDFPREIAILGVEVADPLTIGGPVSEPVQRAIPEIVRRVSSRIPPGTCERTR
jgi:hydrogenase maturation protease